MSNPFEQTQIILRSLQIKSEPTHTALYEQAIEYPISLFKAAMKQKATFNSFIYLQNERRYYKTVFSVVITQKHEITYKKVLYPQERIVQSGKWNDLSFIKSPLARLKRREFRRKKRLQKAITKKESIFNKNTLLIWAVLYIIVQFVFFLLSGD